MVIYLRNKPSYGSPKELPSSIRRRAEEQAALEDPTCRCVEKAVSADELKSKVQFGLSTMEPEQIAQLLPSEVRILEEMRRCKCDTSPTPSPVTDGFGDASTTDVTEATSTVGSTVPDDEPQD
ncbi:uncharacterized protein LOC114366195 [Ostrinia furnacalis]|uniref:uncharacterized protein LOC114366195 n=1 Tax=Ostrinia furnacalis TaxID=93504 RepID=UPI0010404A1F|nr:uncharacterized protein LOC114366195 [Ostrinia furnacalis]